jgi:hypothetical protein
LLACWALLAFSFTVFAVFLFFSFSDSLRMGNWCFLFMFGFVLRGSLQFGWVPWAVGWLVTALFGWVGWWRRVCLGVSAIVSTALIFVHTLLYPVPGGFIL